MLESYRHPDTTRKVVKIIPSRLVLSGKCRGRKVLDPVDLLAALLSWPVWYAPPRKWGSWYSSTISPKSKGRGMFGHTHPALVVEAMRYTHSRDPPAKSPSDLLGAGVGGMLGSFGQSVRTHPAHQHPIGGGRGCDLCHCLIARQEAFCDQSA